MQTAKPSDAVRISNGFTLQMGSFARQGQATYLLSQALRSIQSLPPAMDGDETAQLRRTLLALVHAADSEATIRRLEFCAQSALCLRLVGHGHSAQFVPVHANQPDLKHHIASPRT